MAIKFRKIENRQRLTELVSALGKARALAYELKENPFNKELNSIWENLMNLHIRASKEAENNLTDSLKRMAEQDHSRAVADALQR